MYTYWYHIGVWKQGDDLVAAIARSNGNITQGLRSLAEQYKAAAEQCSELSGYTEAHPGITMDGGASCISLHSPEKLDEATCEKFGLTLEEGQTEEEE